MTLRRPALVLAWLTGCGEAGPTYTEIDLDVDVRLNAVEQADPDFVAVGAEGTVVHHAERFHPRHEHEVVVWQLGHDELWAVDEFAVFEDALDVWDLRWFVAGAAGALWIGVEDDGAPDHPSAAERFTWFAQPRIVDADLYGVAAVESEAGVRAFAVGDEVMLAGTPTSEPGHYEWSALTPPSARGWGTLRDITARWNSGGEWELWAVGDQGRVWYSDLGPMGWVEIETGVTDDLVDAEDTTWGGVGGTALCGVAGSWLQCDRGACTSSRVGALDFVACGGDWALASNRALYDPREPWWGIVRLDWLPRAGDGSREAIVLVGEGGRAGVWQEAPRWHGAL